jgi:multidrug resistance efflux pump
METSANYNIREKTLITWFFRMILGIAILLIVLLFTLKINDDVSFTEGEIIADNPQADFKAPFEARLVRIYVNEGQKIARGDTLMQIYSEEYNRQQVKLTAEIDYLKKKIQSIDILRTVIANKKDDIEKEKFLNEEKFQLDTKKIIADIGALDKQYRLQQERLQTAQERYLTDSILYKKDMLSKMELYNTRDANNNLKENFSSTESQLEKQLTDKVGVVNNYKKELHQFQIRKAELDESGILLIQSKTDLQNQLTQAEESLKEINANLGRQYFIAESAGIVNFIFNVRQGSNLIIKGDLLLSMAPDNKDYYARLYIPQKDIQYIKPGLEAHLKLDAFYHMEYGILKGVLSYVSERKESEKFFALAKLPDDSRFRLKSGYTVKGEILIERMPLYRYIIKKLLKKMDKK